MSQKNNIKIKKVLVVGLGLIGASLCRDLKKNSNYEKIYGHDTDNLAMEYALKNNYVHETRKDLEEGIKDSDLIVLCAPVHAITKVLDVVKYFFNGDKVFTEFKPSRGEKDSYGLQQFKVVAGTGKWTELVGESCIGAFSQITKMDKDFKNASFIWSGKCEVADKTLDRVKNYKKPD